jgi:superfamily II RNA helicase
MEAFQQLEMGHVVVDPGRWRAGPMLVLGIRRNGGEPSAAELLGIDGRRITRRVAEFRYPPTVVATWDIDWQERQRGQARELTRRLASVEVSPFLFKRAAERNRDDGGQRERAREAAACAALAERLRGLERRLPDEFAAMTVLLQQRSHLDGFEPTESGRLLRWLYHPQALLVAEALAAGAFEGTDAAELAAVCAAFRSGSDRMASTAAAMPSGVRERLRAIAAIANDLNHAESLLDLPETPGPDITFVGAVYRWAEGESLAAVLEGGSLLAGDFVREVRQTLELLDQLGAASPGLPTGEAASLIDRGAAAATLYDPFEQ